MNTLNKGDIYLSEEELLLNDLSILDIAFIREKQMKPNLIIRLVCKFD